MSNQLFSISTSNAFQMKILAELLNNTVSEFNLELTATTILIRQSNNEEKCIVDVSLRVEDLEYVAPSQPLIIGITSIHFYKSLKRIKKKDSLLIYMDEDDDTTLKFKIINSDKERHKEASLRIREVPIAHWEIPTYPLFPITTISTAELQRQIKEMVALSPLVEIKIQPKAIKFFAQLKDMSSISDIYGPYDESEEPIYERTFHTKHLSRLSKMTGLAPTFKVYSTPEQPIIQFVAHIGSIGVFKALLLPVLNDDEEQI